MKVSEVPKGDRLVVRIGRLTGAPFTDHGLPADYLLRNRDKILPKLSNTTLDNFESLLVAVNATRA